MEYKSMEKEIRARTWGIW